MSIVGILGLIGSGKNTAAEEFIEMGFQKESFASSLKDACAAIFGWDRELLEGITDESRAFRETPDLFWTKKMQQGNTKLKIEEFTPRFALQYVGTNVMRDNFHQDIWLNSLEYRIRKNPDQSTVISDCRFGNEIDLIRRLGGILIRVDRGEQPDWYSIAEQARNGATPPDRYAALNTMRTEYSDVHQSEWDWVGTDVDYVVKNDGTKDELKEQIHAIYNEIQKKTNIALG